MWCWMGRHYSQVPSKPAPGAGKGLKGKLDSLCSVFFFFAQERPREGQSQRWSSATVRFFTPRPSCQAPMVPCQRPSKFLDAFFHVGPASTINFNTELHLPAGELACSRDAASPKPSQCFRAEVGYKNAVQRAQVLLITCCSEVVGVRLDGMIVLVLGRRRCFQKCRTISGQIVLHQSSPCHVSCSSTIHSSVGLARASKLVHVHVRQSPRYQQSWDNEWQSARHYTQLHTP